MTLLDSAIKNTCFPCFYIRLDIGFNTPGAADLLADLSYTKLLKIFLNKKRNWRSAR